MTDNFIEMQLANITPSGEMRVFAHEMELSLSSPGNSQWIVIPLGVNSIAVTISFTGGGRGKVQHTMSGIQKVKDDQAIEIDWDLGEVDLNISDYAVPVTAIRLVQTASGTSKIEVRAQ